MNPITALTGLFSLAQAGISAAEQYATVAPALVQGVEGVAANGRTVANDVGTLVADLKAGKYADTEADMVRALADFGKVTAAVSAAVPAVASIVAKAPSLPSVTGISTLLKAL